jgi:hypothetical protein
MKYFPYIIFISLFASTENIAQTKEDSLYVMKIDSIVNSKLYQNCYGTDLTFKEVEDTTNYSTILGRYKSGVLADISYFQAYGGCEYMGFHFVDDALVMVEYTIADPDIHSEGPPSFTYMLYYRDNQVVMQKTSDYLGGPKFCTSYDVNKRDFFAELKYCRQLLLKD